MQSQASQPEHEGRKAQEGLGEHLTPHIHFTHSKWIWAGASKTDHLHSHLSRGCHVHASRQMAMGLEDQRSPLWHRLPGQEEGCSLFLKEDIGALLLKNGGKIK